jgi:hypothetical protein
MPIDTPWVRASDSRRRARAPVNIDDPEKARRIIAYLDSSKTPGQEADRLAEHVVNRHETILSGVASAIRRGMDPVHPASVPYPQKDAGDTLGRSARHLQAARYAISDAASADSAARS